MAVDRLQIVQKDHKEMPRLTGIIRVQSGRCGRDAQQLPRMFKQEHFPAGAAAKAEHSRTLQKHCPPLMRGNSQGGGQTTRSLLTRRKWFRGSIYSRQRRFPPPFHDAACFCFAEKIPASFRIRLCKTGEKDGRCFSLSKRLTGRRGTTVQGWDSCRWHRSFVR